VTAEGNSVPGRKGRVVEEPTGWRVLEVVVLDGFESPCGGRGGRTVVCGMTVAQSGGNCYMKDTWRRNRWIVQTCCWPKG
jgi:hypothetical protein